MTLIVFILILAALLGIGLYSARERSKTTSDYLLASRKIHPWLMALSAVSTNNSGFMFIGLIGATYTTGLSSMWLMVGWIAGDYLAWLVIHRRLRERSEAIDAQSFPGVLGYRPGGVYRSVVVVSSLLTVVFLGTYAAAQLTAANKAFVTFFGWHDVAGVLLGAAVISVYSFVGGLRASIWTNSAQSIVMIFSMLILLTAALMKTGGFVGLWGSLRAIDSALIDYEPQNLRFGFLLFVLGWMTAGIGVIGQPHIMTIAMSLDSSESIKRSRRVYFIWYILFSAFCILVGLCCRVLLPIENIEAFDAELALPRLSQCLLNDAMIGMILAGLFAATISTADTQILVCSAAISQNLIPGWCTTYLRTKLITLGVTIGVVFIVIYGDRNVFNLVTLAWSALASSMGPLLAVQAFGRPVNAFVANLMMLAGLGASLYWNFSLGWSDSIYDVLPGMLTGFMVYAVAMPFLRQPSQEVSLDDV